MADLQPFDQLFEAVITKSSLKQKVYSNTLKTLSLMKREMSSLADLYRDRYGNGGQEPEIPFVFKDKGEFEAELKFGGDVLIFMMHSNIFEFSRDHTVMKTPYVREDKNRSYCGIINIFNFLGDSMKYNRINDVGYLIGRIFVNNEMHYFVEGKRELGFVYTDFGSSVVSRENLREVLISSIYYTLNFDLLVPPYDHVKEVSVQDFITAVGSMPLKTGKRLGFRFQADNNSH